MLPLAMSYCKRYKMEVALQGVPAPVWPPGYRAEPWKLALLPDHAEVLTASFREELDSIVFPSLGTLEGCRGLMEEISRRNAFIPEATWLAVGPEGPCGTIQALRDRGMGAIQNIGILPAYRGRKLGEMLLLQSLHGMHRSGLGRAILEVTAENDIAIRLYRRIGFRRTKVIYKVIRTSPALLPGEECPVPIF